MTRETAAVWLLLLALASCFALGSPCCELPGVTAPPATCPFSLSTSFPATALWLGLPTFPASLCRFSLPDSLELGSGVEKIKNANKETSPQKTPKTLTHNDFLDCFSVKVSCFKIYTLITFLLVPFATPCVTFWCQLPAVGCLAFFRFSILDPYSLQPVAHSLPLPFITND